MSAAPQETTVRAPNPARVGKFSYDTVAGAWDWDDDMFRILGREPWSVAPATEHLLSCTDPEVRARVSEGLRRVETTGEPFHLTFRLSAADGVDRWVLIVSGPASPTTAGPVAEITGHVVDLTEDLRHEGAEMARQAVAASAQHRATIERAVGGLMVAYGLDADQAFEMLRWWSQVRNVKVRDLAERLTEAASRGASTGPALRATFDALIDEASS